MKKLEVVIQEAASKAATEAVDKVLQETLSTPGYLNTKQAAVYLGCSTQFLEIARYRGDGPEYLKPSSKMVKYAKSDLDKWMLSHRRSHTAEGVA